VLSLLVIIFVICSLTLFSIVLGETVLGDGEDALGNAVFEENVCTGVFVVVILCALAWALSCCCSEIITCVYSSE